MAEKKRGPGRPRKDPRGTQRQLRSEAHLKQLVTQETEKARVERARREVNRAVREVFGDNPWISKVIAGMFVQSIEKVVTAKTNLSARELGNFVSEAFSATLAECATFDGLSRAASVTSASPPRLTPSVPALPSVPSVMAVAATPDLSSFAEATLGDFDDEVEDLPPISDEDAAVMGFLPEA